MDKIPCFVLRLHFGALIYKTVNILPQTLPLGVGLRLRQMLDGQGIIQKEAEAEDPTVYKIIHILTPGYKGSKGTHSKSSLCRIMAPPKERVCA